MARIVYMSDLHLEMERWRLGVPGWANFRARHGALPAHPARGPMLNELGTVDLVVMAGDIHNGLRGIVYAEQVAEYLAAPVVYVAGNHEFYHHSFDVLLPALARAAAQTQGRVHFLENAMASFEAAGRRLNVLGCTLWTDFALHGDAPTAMRWAERRMNDYVFIGNRNNRFVPQDGLASHRNSIAWLRARLESLRKAEPGALNIVATHHAPDPAYLGTRTGAIAPAYASRLAEDLEGAKPDIWIHGHTHYRHDSCSAGIRFVSAPRGYVVYDGDGALHYRPGVLDL